MIARLYLTRSLWLWCLARALLTLLLLIGGTDPLNLSIQSTIVLVCVILSLGWIEIRRHRELALLGNLAIHPVILSVLLVAPAVAGEIAIRIGLAA